MGWVWETCSGHSRGLIDAEDSLDGKLDLLPITVKQFYGGEPQQKLVPWRSMLGASQRSIIGKNVLVQHMVHWRFNALEANHSRAVVADNVL